MARSAGKVPGGSVTGVPGRRGKLESFSKPALRADEAIAGSPSEKANTIEQDGEGDKSNQKPVKDSNS